MPSPEYTQPENWRLPLLLIDRSAKDGPPEMAQATADLIRPPIKRPFINAVLIARENTWLLDGYR